LGNRIDHSASGPCRIEFFGWQPHDRALELAAECDLGYLGYWFDPIRSEEAKNCFPSKMVSYMGAGLPSFFHGPSYSSPAFFLRMYDVGWICNKNTAQGILDDLAAVLSNQQRLKEWRKNSQKISAIEFSKSVFSKRLASLLHE
jgi:hypothetical protein